MAASDTRGQKYSHIKSLLDSKSGRLTQQKKFDIINATYSLYLYYHPRPVHCIWFITIFFPKRSNMWL